jgi:hypothetical protein
MEHVSTKSLFSYVNKNCLLTMPVFPDGRRRKPLAPKTTQYFRQLVRGDEVQFDHDSPGTVHVIDKFQRTVTLSLEDGTYIEIDAGQLHVPVEGMYH